jgi:site-specific recombinase XerD
VLTADEQIADDFLQYLEQQCGLTRKSIIRHVPVLRRFLEETSGNGARKFAKLTGAAIIGFVEHHARDYSPDAAKAMCSTLRTFLRYLQFRGFITTDLASAVPTVRRWRFTSLPTYLSAEQVQKALDSCNRRTAMGRRDYAVLMMLARLGLRANEIATLTLDDVHWRSAQLTIRGKGRRRAQMPLPPDVGAAVVAYLERGRPQSDSRRVFLKVLAPHIGFASSSSISLIAKQALIRANIFGIAHGRAYFSGIASLRNCFE